MTAKCLDVHLMIVEPERYVARFAEAGADIVTFHYEATYDPRGCIEMIRKAGAKAGVSIKPATSVEVLRDILPLVDLVLVMSVEPGFGGQSFIPGFDREDRSPAGDGPGAGLADRHRGRRAASRRTMPGEVYQAGADVLVAGNAVFGAADPQAEIVRCSTPGSLRSASRMNRRWRSDFSMTVFVSNSKDTICRIKSLTLP